MNTMHIMNECKSPSDSDVDDDDNDDDIIDDDSIHDSDYESP